MNVLLLLTVGAEELETARNSHVLRRDKSGLSTSTEILYYAGTKAADSAEAAHALPLIRCAMGMGAVLNEVHPGGLAEG